MQISTRLSLSLSTPVGAAAARHKLVMPSGDNGGAAAALKESNCREYRLIGCRLVSWVPKKRVPIFDSLLPWQYDLLAIILG